MPIPSPPQWACFAIDSLDGEALRESTVPEPRDLLRSGLGLGVLDPGSPHIPAPLHESIPGRDTPELRVDGLAVAPVRWGETSPSTVPVLALSHVRLRRYSPIDGPLSSTGGPVIDARLAPVPHDRAYSAVRLSRANFGTFTEEAVLRRPFGPTDFALFYGDSKSRGSGLWRSQKGETFGMRITHGLARGGAEWLYDNARTRFHLLSTKKGLWDRRAVGLRWFRSDSTRGAIETSLRWTSMDAGWWTLLGLTQRETRAVDFRGRWARARGGDRFDVALEGEIAATRFVRPGEERELHSGIDGFSLGAAAGWSREAGGAVTRASAGAVRLAPLGVSGVFALEHERSIGVRRSILFHANRAVRNRTLPRLPADGEAWVRQGLGLADERTGEQPAAVWKAGVETRARFAELSLAAGVDGMATTRSPDAGLVDLLATDQQGSIRPADARRTCYFGTPWGGIDWRLPGGLRAAASGSAHWATGGVKGHLGLPAGEGRGELNWSGRFLKNDLWVRLGLLARARTPVETPYGRIPAQGILDGEAQIRVGDLDIFFVLANLTDALATSMSYDGAFMYMPLRNYRAGLRWAFFN
jgi:hypothetical protein